PTREPLSPSETGTSHGEGGHTAAATAADVTPFVTAAASAVPSASDMDIFQLTATYFFRAALKWLRDVECCYAASGGSVLARGPELAPECAGEAAEVAHQVEELVRQQRLRAVGERLLGAVVDLDVYAVGARRHARPAHARDQVR